ncbi:MAG: hypothetical protein AAB384_02690 [Patescibacteria group bacterium]
MNHRLMTFPDIIRSGWELYVKGARLLTRVGLVFAAISLLGAAQVFVLWFAILTASPAGARLAALYPFLESVRSALGMPFLWILSIVGVFVTFALLCYWFVGAVRAVQHVHSTPEEEQIQHIRTIYADAFTMVPSLFFVVFLLGITLQAGYYAYILPAVLFACWFFFVGFVVVLENMKGIQAFKRSRALVIGRTRAMMGRLVVLVGAAVLFSLASDFLLTQLQLLAFSPWVEAIEQGSTTAAVTVTLVSIVVSMIPLIVLTPIFLCMAYTLYVNARETTGEGATTVRRVTPGSLAMEK